MEKRYLELLSLQQELQNTNQFFCCDQRHELLEYEYPLSERWFSISKQSK